MSFTEDMTIGSPTMLKEGLSEREADIMSSFHSAFKQEHLPASIDEGGQSSSKELSDEHHGDEDKAPSEYGGSSVQVVHSRIFRITRGTILLALAGITFIGGAGLSLIHGSSAPQVVHHAAVATAPPVTHVSSVVAAATTATKATAVEGSYLLADGAINFNAEPQIPDNYLSLPKDQIRSIFSKKENFIQKVISNTKISPQTLELYQDKLSVLQEMKAAAAL